MVKCCIAVLSALFIWLDVHAQAPNSASASSINSPTPDGVSPLTLHEAIERVIIHNESLQAKLIDAEIARRQYKAEKGIFEPAVVGAYEHLDSERENTKEQQQSLGRIDYFERNDSWSGGLEQLAPIGSRFRLGYSMRRLVNPLNTEPFNGRAVGPEYVSMFGLTATQPLLKGFGLNATLARIRLAAISSDIAYQEYRRQLMLTLSRAESAYWDLYFSQEQARISDESLRTAQAIYNDNKARIEVGKSSELEVLQAESGVSLRRARRVEALQKLAEAANQLNTLISGTGSETNITIWASEAPQLREVSLNYYDGYGAAIESNPDYLTRKQQAVAENVRLAYTKNQRLPQLDLKGSYGLNGLGYSPSASHEDLEQGRFPAWSVGVELRIPVTGGIRERNEYQAAKLAKQKALVNLKEVEVQLGNALGTAILKVNNMRDSVQNYRSVAAFHQQLLENQLTRLQVGVIDSRTVLETEEKLFEARIASLENVVSFQKALLELDLVKGTTLINRDLDLSKAELQDRTEKLLAAHRFAGPELETLRTEVEQEYRERINKLDAKEKPESFMDRVFR